jgi:type VI protein secretion system component VasK
VPRVGVADRLRSWAEKVRANPWLAVGVTAGVLLVCAWIAWAIHVGSDHGTRQALGVLIVWPAILAVLAIISIPFIWAFRVIRASAGSDEDESNSEPESAEAEATETG